LEGKINGKGNDEAGTEKLYPEEKKAEGRRLKEEG
jgi:hypothetical protein